MGKISQNKELEAIRGMSDPFFFAANVIEEGRKVVIHAVVFTSFEVPGKGENDARICALDSDPRMRAFVNFVWSNYLYERKDKALEKLNGLEAQIEKDKAELAELERKNPTPPTPRALLDIKVSGMELKTHEQ